MPARANEASNTFPHLSRHLLRRLTRVVALAVALLSGRASLAAVPLPDDFQLERMRLSLDRSGLLDVEWAAVPQHLSWDVGLWSGYSKNPLVLYDPVTGDRAGSLVSDRASGALVGALGLFGWAQVGFELPVSWYQGRPSTQPGVTTEPLPELRSLGFADLRIVPKFQLLRAKDHVIDLALMPIFYLPTGGGSAYSGERGASFTPELAISLPLGAFRTAFNLGGFLRPSRTFLEQTVDSELNARLAAGYRFWEQPGGGPPVEVDVAVSGAVSAAAPFASANQNALELRGQVQWLPIPWLVLFAGGGAGLSRGWGTPDWRLFAGARLGDWKEPDTDGDGIADKTDACPTVPEDKDAWEDTDGCPEPDNDGDGVLDVNEARPECVNVAEDPDAFEDEDGCLEPDNDQDGVNDLDESKPECVNDPEDKDSFEDSDGCPDPDNDQDGVLDVAEARPDCVNVAEDKDAFEDADGCVDPDNDQDGVKDGDEARADCVNVPEDKDSFEDSDGCPDPDNDQDNVFDLADRCPLQAGVVENAGCPDTDRDTDTVVDRLDNCPDEPGDPANAGCKKKQLVVIKKGKIEILDTVYFKVNADVIETRSYGLLDNVASVIVAHPEIPRVRVEGHTDSQGKAAYNRDLSQRRAESVVRYLVSKQVEAARLEAKGFGPDRPIAPNTTAKGRANNRRVEFNIVDAPPTLQKSGNEAGTDTLELEILP